METPLLDWENVGETLGEVATNMTQLMGLVRLIALIVKAASNPRILKRRCRRFAQRLQFIGNLLGELITAELMDHHNARAPLKRLEDVLRGSYILVDYCHKASFMNLFIVGCHIATKLKQAQEEIDFYMKLIPLIAVVDIQRLKAAITYPDQLVVDPTHHLYSNETLRNIEHFVHEVNPSNVPLVVGQLLDDDCSKDFIKGLIMSVRSRVPVEPLIEECENRNQLRLLIQFLQYLVSEGSRDVHVHNALGKTIIDTNDNPEHFLTTNPYHDSRVLGKYCEKRYPTLAATAYRRGQCDDELIDVTNKNSLFKFQASYVVERMKPELWEKVLSPGNAFRRQLIDQVASTALPESNNSDQVSATLQAFITAELTDELIDLLEKIVLQNSAFSGDSTLQNLLIRKAIKDKKSRVMDYVKRLHKFDGPAIIEIAVGEGLYEEAFAIFEKFNLNSKAENVWMLSSLVG